MRLFLSMDGGGVMSLATLVMVRRIEERFPGFLKRADAFGGTSAGGMNALLMACHEDPIDGLADAMSLWNGDVPIYSQSCWRELGAFAGKVAVYDNKVLKAYLESRLGDLRLKDLRHRVVAVTVALDATFGDGRRAWRPKIFDSQGVVDPRDRDTLAVDVGLSTGAFPITFPVYDGYVDGGVVANNPALCLLLHDMKVTRRAATEALPGSRLLSIGTGMGAAAIEGEDLDWGYRQWLFQPGHTGLFADLVMTAPMELVSEQCGLLLGSDGFFRLNPWPEKVVRPSREMVGAKQSGGGLIDQMRAHAIALGEEADLDRTFKWIEASGWMEKEPVAQRSATPARSRRSAAASPSTHAR